jgi:hypothetical protein
MDAPSNEEVAMQLHHLRREPPGAQAVPGNGAASQAMPVPGPARAGSAAPGMAAQLCVIAGMLAGLWVTISPWFLSLQAYGGNATACNGTMRSAAACRPCGRRASADRHERVSQSGGRAECVSRTWSTVTGMRISAAT